MTPIKLNKYGVHWIQLAQDTPNDILLKARK